MQDENSKKSNLYKKLTVALSLALVICIVFVLSVLYGKDELFNPQVVITLPAASTASPSSLLVTEAEFLSAMEANAALGHEFYTYGERTVSDGVVEIGIASDTRLDTGDLLTVVGWLALRVDADGLVSGARLELTVIPDAAGVGSDIRSATLIEDAAIAEAFLLAADAKLQMLSASACNEILRSIGIHDTLASALEKTYGAYTVSISPPSVSPNKKFIIDLNLQAS